MPPNNHYRTHSHSIQGTSNSSTTRANIYTKDLSEGIKASEQLQAGMVWVNAPLLDNDAGPFGGTKLSGLGRQLGPEGIETFRETKTVMIDPDCNPQDFWWFPYADNEAYSKK